MTLNVGWFSRPRRKSIDANQSDENADEPMAIDKQSVPKLKISKQKPSNDYEFDTPNQSPSKPRATTTTKSYRANQAATPAEQTEFIVGYSTSSSRPNDSDDDDEQNCTHPAGCGFLFVHSIDRRIILAASEVKDAMVVAREEKEHKKKKKENKEKQSKKSKRDDRTSTSDQAEIMPPEAKRQKVSSSDSNNRVPGTNCWVRSMSGWKPARVLHNVSMLGNSGRASVA